MPLKVCAVTGTRADWGLLVPVLILMQQDPAFDLKVVVTGQDFQERARQIAGDAFAVARVIDMNLTDDTPRAVTSSAANAIAGYAEAYEQLKPDLLLVDGDRYEILGAVFAAYLARIPIAHIGGGDVTEGAVDDAFRHAISKMSHLHFVSTSEAARRVCQLGEEPSRVFAVGSTGLDHIRSTPLLDRAAFFETVGLTPREKNAMVTFHPETLASDSVRDCREMLDALDRLGAGVGLIFSGTNADVQGLEIGKLIATFVTSHPNAVLHSSLGSQRYFSALKHVDVVVGNSSSGLYEAPSFGTPTVNIGDRQKGRLRAPSVTDVQPQREAINAAILKAFALDRMAPVNPYGDGYAAEKIITHLKAMGDPRRLLKKQFIDQNPSTAKVSPGHL